MKKDLESIFKRIKSIKSKVSKSVDPDTYTGNFQDMILKNADVYDSFLAQLSVAKLNQSKKRMMNMMLQSKKGN